MDSYTILCTELRGSAQSLKGNIDTLQKKADKLQKAINKVTHGDYKASDLSSAYTAQTALSGSITRLGEICGAMNTAALQFSEASTELSGRANLTAYYMQHTDTLSYEGLMGTYTAAIASAGSAAAGYELTINTLEKNGCSTIRPGAASTEAAISTYESDHPNTAKKIDELLRNSGLSSTDIKEIKYLVYTAPEPYRTAYINNLGKYRVDLFEKEQFLSGSSGYNGFFNIVSIKNTPNDLSKNPRGAYNTFFHESGHAIDDVSKILGNKTEGFEYNGSSLYDLISEDVRENISGYICEKYPDLSETEKYTLLRSMNLTDDAEFRYKARETGLDNSKLDKIRTEILDYYYDYEMEGYDNEAVCDIYGGITNEVFYKESDGVHLGHVKADYWYSNTSKGIYLGIFKGNYDYKTGEFFYSVDDQAGTQASELWAEFFAAQMTKDVAALQNIKEHFPKAYEAMEKMAFEIAEG